MPLLSLPSSANSHVTRNVPVLGSTTGAMRATLPLNFTPGSASTSMLAVSPGLSVMSSRSGTFSTASSGSKSSMRNSAWWSWIRFPSLTMRWLSTPSMGAVICV